MSRSLATTPQRKSLVIRVLDDVPDIMEVDVRPVDYLVEELLPSKSLTLWAGSDGTAKTYLAKKLAVSVALGGHFLNRPCTRSSVLYLDYENPDHEVKRRQETLAGGMVPGLKTWGTWLDPQPPQIGDSLLLKIAAKARPVMIFDPFRYAHDAEENDASEMMPIMRHLRSYASAGATVIVLHHPAKAEGSTGRGSTVIRGAVDIAYLQEMSDDGLITLRCVKNRFGGKPSITVRPNFDSGQFDVVDSPAVTDRKREVVALMEAIEATPGVTTNDLIAQIRIGRKRMRAA